MNDRKPVEFLCENKVRGLLVGDKGYLGKSLAMRLKRLGVKLVIKVRRIMPSAEHTPFEQVIIKKRAIV